MRNGSRRYTNSKITNSYGLSSLWGTLDCVVSANVMDHSLTSTQGFSCRMVLRVYYGMHASDLHEKLHTTRKWCSREKMSGSCKPGQHFQHTHVETQTTKCSLYTIRCLNFEAFVLHIVKYLGFRALSWRFQTCAYDTCTSTHTFIHVHTPVHQRSREPMSMLLHTRVHTCTYYYRR